MYENPSGKLTTAAPGEAAGTGAAVLAQVPLLAGQLLGAEDDERPGQRVNGAGSHR